MQYLRKNLSTGCPVQRCSGIRAPLNFVDSLLWLRSASSLPERSLNPQITSLRNFFLLWTSAALKKRPSSNDKTWTLLVTSSPRWNAARQEKTIEKDHRRWSFWLADCSAACFRRVWPLRNAVLGSVGFAVLTTPINSYYASFWTLLHSKCSTSILWGLVHSLFLVFNGWSLKGEGQRKMNFTYVLGFVVLRDVVKVFPVSSSSFARKTTGRNRARSHSGAWRGLKTKWDLKLSPPSPTYVIRYLFI